MTDFKKIKLFAKQYHAKKLTTFGWIKYHRVGKKVSFLALTDGLSNETLQIVYHQKFKNYLTLNKLLPGSALKVIGTLTIPEKGQEKIELIAQEILCIDATKPDYFLQNKFHTKVFLRQHLPLRSRTSWFMNVFRIRSQLSFQIHQYFNNQGFVQINNPILTNNDCEGGGEVFIVNNQLETEKDRKHKDEFSSSNFFSEPVNLTVSGQLHLEGFAQCFQKVYTFSPIFRADPSHTTVHTPEFWMLEPEVAFAKKQDGMDLVKNLLKAILQTTYVSCIDSLKELTKLSKIDLLSKWTNLINHDYPTITYTKAIEILQSKGTDKAIKQINWGDDFTKDQEIFLTKLFNNLPIFIVDYPINQKPFYMKRNNDDKTVACFDLLCPEVGEIVGGSERENDLNVLLRNNNEKALNSANKLMWYYQLRTQGFGGSTGFGLGFDRLLMYLTASEHINDVIPYFVKPKKLNY